MRDTLITEYLKFGFLLRKHYFILILQIAPFSVLVRPFYDIGPFKRHNFANFLPYLLFSGSIISRNYRTSVAKIGRVPKRARLVLFGNDDCTFVTALALFYLCFRSPSPTSTTKFLSQVCPRSSILASRISLNRSYMESKI